MFPNGAYGNVPRPALERGLEGPLYRSYRRQRQSSYEPYADVIKLRKSFDDPIYRRLLLWRDGTVCRLVSRSHAGASLGTVFAEVCAGSDG